MAKDVSMIASCRRHVSRRLLAVFSLYFRVAILAWQWFILRHFTFLHAGTGMEVRDGGTVGGCLPLCTRVLCHLKPDTLLVVG